jgi:hypothetical protein
MVIAGKPLFPTMVTDKPYAPSPANGEEHVAFDRVLEWESHFEVASYDICGSGTLPIPWN